MQEDTKILIIVLLVIVFLGSMFVMTIPAVREKFIGKEIQQEETATEPSSVLRREELFNEDD